MLPPPPPTKPPVPPREENKNKTVYDRLGPEVKQPWGTPLQTPLLTQQAQQQQQQGAVQAARPVLAFSPSDTVYAKQDLRARLNLANPEQAAAFQPGDDEPAPFVPTPLDRNLRLNDRIVRRHDGEGLRREVEEVELPEGVVRPVFDKKGRDTVILSPEELAIHMYMLAPPSTCGATTAPAPTARGGTSRRGRRTADSSGSRFTLPPLGESAIISAARTPPTI